MKKLRSFASLTEQELNQVAPWVAHESYDVVIERIARPSSRYGFGLKLINARIDSGQPFGPSEFEAIEWLQFFYHNRFDTLG